MTNKQKQLYLPDEIILLSLMGRPKKVEIPIHGGLDDGWIRVFYFTLKSEQPAVVCISFDIDNGSYMDITFGFEGIEELMPEDFIGEFDEKANSQELSILKQAINILKKHKRTTKYQKAMEDRVAFIAKRNIR